MAPARARSAPAARPGNSTPPPPQAPATIHDPIVLATSVADDKVVDFIDGTVRGKTPEEYVRQNVERSLVQEYRYPRDEIAVEYRVKVGAARKSVDLAIFYEGQPRTQENVLAIIECKKETVSPHDKKEGVEQLKSYMAASVNCRFGMWTNGSSQRLCYRRDEVSGKVDFVDIIDIPVKGNELKDDDVPDRLQLTPASGDNLLLAFKRCHNYIAGNQGLQKPEAFWELLKVIFCKIEDERSLDPLQFYVSSREQRSPSGQLKCRKRLDALFALVRTKYSAIFKTTEDIDLNRTVLSYVVGQLQGFSLLESQVDVKGVAYEEIVGSNLRGDRGEFFTPRNACRMAVHVLDPDPNARIVDPACGTGGFLVTAMHLVMQKYYAATKARWRDPERASESERAELYRATAEYLEKSVVGLDINPNLVRAAKMNMVMNNDGSGGLTQADSLREPVTWSDEARSLAPLGSFDFLFTNPPFGTNIRIDSPEVLQQYDLAAQWDWVDDSGAWVKRIGPKGIVYQSAQPPEVLFIERALKFLKPGTGRMAMVIPNGILNNPPLGYVRQWVLRHAQLLAVVDMHRDLFQPRNDTQTSMVFLRRFTPDEEAAPPRDYPIFFCVADKIGHDKRGNTIYRRDVDGTDLLAARTRVVTTVVGGERKEETIEDLSPIVDDQLPDIPQLFHRWTVDHGI